MLLAILRQCRMSLGDCAMFLAAASSSSSKALLYLFLEGVESVVLKPASDHGTPNLRIHICPYQPAAVLVYLHSMMHSLV